jgi:Mrp family chromosome partitioning ATPase
MDLNLLASARALRLLVVTSERAAGTSSYIAATIAELWAQAGRRVLLVDAQLAAPTVERRYGLRQAPGLTEALGDMSVAEGDLSAYLTPSPVPYLMLLPAGQAAGHSGVNQYQLLASEAGGRVLDALLLSEAEVVVVDAPPLAPNDALAPLAARADGVILVADAARSTSRTLERSVAALRAADAELVALVLRTPLRGRAAGAMAQPQLARAP